VAFAIASYINSNKGKPASSYGEAQDMSPVVNIVNSPGRIVGRPFSDPFYANYGGSAVWGSGPWAHRSPRMRPITPHFGPRRH
jgi:hypothetical protein